MRVENASLCRRILFVVENVFQFLIFISPSKVMFVKSLRQTAPTDVFRKHFLFLVGCLFLRDNQPIDKFNGFDVVSETLLRAAEFALRKPDFRKVGIAFFCGFVLLLDRFYFTACDTTFPLFVLFFVQVSNRQ